MHGSPVAVRLPPVVSTSLGGERGGHLAVSGPVVVAAATAVPHPATAADVAAAVVAVADQLGL